MHAQDEIVRAFATALNIIIIFGIFSALQLALKNMLIQMVDQMIEFMEFSLQTIKINLWILSQLAGGHVCLFTDSVRMVWPEIPHRNISRFNDETYLFNKVFIRRGTAMPIAYLRICIRKKVLLSINRDVKLTAA